MRFVLCCCVALLGCVAAAQQPAVSAYDQANLERNLRWILDRERAAGREKDRKVRPVAVYADLGVWHPGARSVVEALEREGVWCATLDRSQLTDDGLRGFDALVLPGGFAPTQWGGAGEKGLKAIRAYVERGGRCVGICAGAYLLSRTVKYDGKSYDYPLGLHDGSAVGPVKGLSPFPKPGSARLKPTEAGRTRGLADLGKHDVYYSGGPCFEGGTGVTVLAEYADRSAAVIARRVGKGEVVLIGGHAERPAGSADDAAAPRWAGGVLKALVLPKRAD